MRTLAICLLVLVTPVKVLAADPCWCAFHHLILPEVNGNKFTRSPFGFAMFRSDGTKPYFCPELDFTFYRASKFSVDGGALSEGFCNSGIICSTPDLPDGPHQVSYQCNLSDDHTYTKEGFEFTVDDTHPQIVISSPASGAVLAVGTITFSGTISDGGGIGIKSFHVPWDFQTQPQPDIPIVLAGFNQGEFFLAENSSGAWTIEKYLVGGTFYGFAWVAAQDLLGNFSTAEAIRSSVIRLTIDGAGPTLSITSPSGDVSPITTISGTAKDEIALKEVRLEIRHNLTGKYWDGSAFISAADPPPHVLADGVSGSSAVWTYTRLSPQVLVVDSSYTIAAQAVDSVGNLSVIAYSTFTYGIVPRVTIRALKGKMNVPSVIQAAGSFEVSYGDKAELCATVDPPSLENRVGFRSKGRAFLQPTWGKTGRCTGLTVAVRSTTTVCQAAGAIEAVLDGTQPTMGGKAQGSIILPTSEFAFLKPENKGVECDSDPVLREKCRVADVYRVAVEAASEIQTLKLNLPGVLLREELEPKQRRGCLPSCPFNPPKKTPGELSHDPELNRWVVNDILGMPITVNNKCGNIRVQHIFVGECLVGTAIHSVLAVPLAETKGILKDHGAELNRRVQIAKAWGLPGCA